MSDLEKKSKKGIQKLNKTGGFEKIESEIHAGIDDLLEDNSEADAASKPISKSTWFFAAALALLAIVAYFIFPRATSNNNDQLFASYFEPFPDVISETVRNESQSTSKASMDYYNAGKYKEAIVAFQKEQSIENREYLYLAISHLATSDPKSAWRDLEKINPDSIIKDGVIWYKALTKLDLGEKENARIILKQIATSDHYKKEDAKSLLDKLK